MRGSVLLLVLLALLTLAIPFLTVGSAGRLSSPSLTDQGLSDQTPAESGSFDTSPPESSKSSAAEEDIGSGEEYATASFSVKGSDSFSILNLSTGSIDTVPVYDYVLGALASEMPPTFDIEALTAQAVAAHTWAEYSKLYHAQHPDETLNGADFSADPSNDSGYVTKERIKERLGESFDLYYPKLCQAAATACGYLLTYDSKPALTAYHSASSGYTEGSENVWSTSLPYLVPVESEGDPLSPNFAVETDFSCDEMRSLLSSAFPDALLDPAEPNEWIKVLETSPSGYITRVAAGGSEVTGQQLRQALSLRSSCLDIEFDGDKFYITSYGYGHGVGMSQYGAQYMAQNGHTFDEILLHYYPGCVLTAVTPAGLST